MNKTVFPIGDKLAVIKETEWDYSFDPDEVLKINYSNIFGEIITIPVLVNRMGWLVAELAYQNKIQKLELESKEADLRRMFRKQEDVSGRKKPSIQEVDDYVTLDPIIRDLRFKLFKSESDLQKIDSIYNATKDKSFKLNNLSKNLVPADYENELMSGVVNGVQISIKNRQFSK